MVCEWSSLALYATYPQQFKAALLQPAGTGTVAGLVVCAMRPKDAAFKDRKSVV